MDARVSRFARDRPKSIVKPLDALWWIAAAERRLALRRFKAIDGVARIVSSGVWTMDYFVFMFGLIQINIRKVNAFNISCNVTYI